MSYGAPRAGRSPHGRGRPLSRALAGRAGFTLVEVLIVIAILGLSYAIALPAISRARIAAAVQNSHHVVVSSVSLARATAIRYGRPAVMRLDPDADRLWIEVDTTAAGSAAALDTLGAFDFAAEMNVDLQSDRTGLCFNGRGIGTTGSRCPRAGGVIILSLQDKADTVVVTPLGRVIR